MVVDADVAMLENPDPFLLSYGEDFAPAKVEKRHGHHQLSARAAADEEAAPLEYAGMNTHMMITTPSARLPAAAVARVRGPVRAVHQHRAGRARGALRVERPGALPQERRHVLPAVSVRRSGPPWARPASFRSRLPRRTSSAIASATAWAKI